MFLAFNLSQNLPRNEPVIISLNSIYNERFLPCPSHKIDHNYTLSSASFTAVLTSDGNVTYTGGKTLLNN
jgi:hypothetical protein